ncbi:MAG: isoleucine--tRNA ligase [Candidatus Babeliales bacterium]
MSENSSTKKSENSFKNSLNLPQTDFPIWPSHAEIDAKMLKRWQDEGLYAKAMAYNAGKSKFILNDGPPYSNGHIHLGHAYNKILKDISCKSRRMAGLHVPTVPVWDCHGLPIELKVTQEHPGLTGISFIEACRIYAQKWVNIQRDEFKKLGVLFDWDNPRMTMDYPYEASILRAFGSFVAQGYIERKLRTVPWCYSCQTVLAAAEIEYQERKDPSVYVRFPLPDATIAKALPELKGKAVSLLVWTTTPWTLPLNRAVLMKPTIEYAVLEHEGNYFVVGASLADAVCAKAGFAKNVVTTVTSANLAGQLVNHPFIAGQQVPIIVDTMVATDEGTAFVHCAPGCGPVDYDVAVKNKLEVFSPLSPDGKYTKGIQPVELEGMSIDDGQWWVLKKLAELGTLFVKESVRHSYPHCWRCHKGLMFRATKQWFCKLEHKNLKGRALEVVENELVFMPPTGKQSLRATIDTRLEWCLSRQRTWGVPIPGLICKTCDCAFISKELIEKVAEHVEHEGISYWQKVSIEQLTNSLECRECKGTIFEKEADIIDVWFESGVSHYAVLEKDPILRYPADLYLEGIDQYRAWFQSSLLTSLVVEGTPCTKAFLAHGFTVDEKGHKMSKSLGNVVAPDDITKQLGTDGLRLWVASLDYGDDAVVSEKLMKNVAQVYRKVRNTCRFLLSNLYDFDITRDAVELNKLQLIDQHALLMLSQFNDRVRKAYEDYNFTAIFHELADYSSVELSAFYLDVIKDRLYVEDPTGHKRRSAQTACWYILDTLTKLMAPILSFAAEEVSDEYQKNKTESIHLQGFVNLEPVVKALVTQGQKRRTENKGEVFDGAAFMAHHERQWELLFKIRSQVMKAIEKQRELGIIKHPLEVALTIRFNLAEEEMAMLQEFLNDLEQTGQNPQDFYKEFFVVSEVDDYYDDEDEFDDEEDEFEDEDEFDDEDEDEDEDLFYDLSGLEVRVDRASGDKCPRCWQYEVTDHALKLCSRCQCVMAKLEGHA